LDSVTFSEPIITAASNSFVFLKVDADSNAALAKLYGVSGYPTMVITKPNGAEVDRLVGFYPPKEFVTAMLDLMTNRNTLDYLLSKAIVHNDSLELLMDIGKNYYYRGDNGKATFYYAGVMEKDAKNEKGLADDCWSELAYMKSRDGKIDEAVEMYEQIGEKYPNSDMIDDALMSIGHIYRRDGQVKNAVKVYKSFAEKHPDSDLVDLSLIMVPYTYQKNEQDDKALKLYQKYLQDYPESERVEWVNKQIASIEEEKGKK
jgi:outer membrane protein assembly factor BamD (BamD/ComL family)